MGAIYDNKTMSLREVEQSHVNSIATRSTLC